MAAEKKGVLDVAELRQRAQEELVQIRIEDREIEQARRQACSEVEKYMKVSRSKSSRKSPTRTPSPKFRAGDSKDREDRKEEDDDETTVKAARLRPAQDVIDRIRWDPVLRIQDFTIGYLERFDGILSMPAQNWLRETTEEDFIPQHRIKWIRRRLESGEEEIVWDRDDRVDRLFGSGGG